MRRARTARTVRPAETGPRLHGSKTGSTGVVVLLAGLMGVAGCKPVGPDYQKPTYTAPAAYKEAGASTAVVPPPSPQGGSWQPASPSDGLLKGKW